MDQEIIQLKKKIKDLQKELCDRTRNYLYHFKKSPSKKSQSTHDQSIQTQHDYDHRPSYQLQAPPQDSCFAQVTLDQYYESKAVAEGAGQSGYSQYKKVKSTLIPLDIDTANRQYGSESTAFQPTASQPNHHGDIDNLALEIKLMKEQLQNSRTPRNKHELKFQFLNSHNMSTPGKQTSNNPLEFSKKRQFDTIQQETDQKSSTQSNQKSVDYDQKLIEYDHLASNNKIMKKQIKKLKALLEHEVQASTQTKAALLISQQQNYKFRLKMQRLNKQIQILTGASTDSDVERYERPLMFEAEEPALSSVESEKSQSTKEELQRFKGHAQKYEQHIFILEGVKRDYLKKCIQAKEEIYKLKQENSQLKGQIERLKRGERAINESEMGINDQKVLEEDGKWQEVVRWKIHEISNCLPVGKNEQLCLFKPETAGDSVQVLERILGFCKNVQRWQTERIQRIQRQRANLLKVISGVLTRHPDTRQALTDEIMQINQLKYVVAFLTKQPKSMRVLGSPNSLEERKENLTGDVIEAQ